MASLKWPFGIVVVLVLVAALVVALPAGSQQPGPRNVITIFDPNPTNYEKHLDLGRKGFGPGDIELFIDTQFDPATCEKLGPLVGRIQFSKLVGQEDAWFVGDFTLRLADGKITAAASAKFSEFAQADKAVFAVTGGTGAYRDASGEVTFMEENAVRCEREGTLYTVDVGPQASP